MRNHLRQSELGEVRVPTVRGRALIQLIEPESRDAAVTSAKLRLQTFRQRCRRRASIRLWYQAGRQNLAIYMGAVELINLSTWETCRVRELVKRICADLRLRQQVRFLFQDRWTELDASTGEIVMGSENDETTWDGDAWEMSDGGLVRVCLSPSIVFPLVWDINSALPGDYLRRVTWFTTPEEMFLYLAAHELRHLWQFEHPKRLQQICRLLYLDDEGDADIYALRVLSRHRLAQHPDGEG